MKEGRIKREKNGGEWGSVFVSCKVIPYFSLLSIGHATKCLGMI